MYNIYNYVYTVPSGERSLQLQICGFHRVNHLPIGQMSVAKWDSGYKSDRVSINGRTPIAGWFIVENPSTVKI